MLACLLLTLSCTALRGQTRLLGLFQSPKGAGLSLMLDRDGQELDCFTLRTDFYGVLTGRTEQVGFCLTYTHDYSIFVRERERCLLTLHAGAGGTGGYVHDYEKGFLSAYDRRLERAPGWMAALTGHIGLRADFRCRISVGLGFSVHPGIHLRTDPGTGALIVSLYRNGIQRAYLPQINLLYRF